MLRVVTLIVGVVVLAVSAHAEVWMVKSSGVVGCRDRETLAKLDPSQASHDGAAPDGCVLLYPGERLLDQPEVGVGFNEFIRVQRHDSSTVFVTRSAIVADPGIGSATDDRAE
jgi:hypothetical protein